MSVTPEFRYKTLRSHFELFEKSDVIQRAGIKCAFGKAPEDWQSGLPFIRWEPAADSFARGGQQHQVDTALPLKPGAPNSLATAHGIWTRAAGVDLYLHASAKQSTDELLTIAVLALEGIEGVRGNYDLVGGRSMPQDSNDVEGDLYILSITISLPIYQLQKRVVAGGYELTKQGTTG